MKIENSEMKVTIKNNQGVIEMKKFDAEYNFKLDENNKVIARSALALRQAIKARDMFGF